MCNLISFQTIHCQKRFISGTRKYKRQQKKYGTGCKQVITVRSKFLIRKFLTSEAKIDGFQR